MKANLGQTSLPIKRRSGSPMSEFDRLPKFLREWLNEAILPWSPVSVRRVWLKSLKKGLSNQDVLVSLRKSERQALKKEKSNYF